MNPSRGISPGWDKSLTLVILCLFGIFQGSLLAQTAETGALTGTVKDSSGAVLPNATVTITSTTTGQTRTATTGSDGVYKVNLLPPGVYRVTFAASGFKTAEVPSATINVTETEELDRALEVGVQNQQVTVQGEVETIQTTSSALGTVVNSQTLTEIPLSTRNYTNILAMSAGTSSDVNNATTMGKGSTNIAVNGAGTAQNTYLQDGVAVNNWYSLGGTIEGASLGAFAIPNPDAIQEFKIQTSTYDAGYGRNPGANVNVITKSGSNEFHGTAFEFFRNTILNANDWFRNFTGGSRLVLNQNQYGGVLGGPIKKDKLFFFVSYQETGQKSGAAPYSYSVDTLAPIPGINRGTCPVGWTLLSQCDSAAQAFVPALGAAICPTNNPSNSKDVTSIGGLQVACNGSDINPVAIKILQLKLSNGNYLIPGSGSGNYQTATFTDPAIFNDHQAMGNFDYLIDSKNTLSGRFEYERDPLHANFPAINGITPIVALPGSPVTTTKTDHAAVLRLTSVLSNSIVNEVRIAYQRYVSDSSEGSPFTNSEVGVTDLSPGIDYLSNFTISGLFSLGASGSYFGHVPENQFEWADQISWTHGKHNARAGFEAQRIQMNYSNPGVSIGSPTFKSFPDFLIGRASCAPSTFGTGAGQCNANNPGPTNGTASTSNVSSNGGSANAAFDFRERETNASAFVQDDIKVNSRLTLNLGLRWEWFGFLTLKGGTFSDLWTSLVNTVPIPGSTPATGTMAGFIVPSNYQGPLPSGLYQNSSKYPTRLDPPWDDFAPRVGFAWQPLTTSRLVLRGGGGYFYSMLAGAGDGAATMAVTSPFVINPSAGASGATLMTPWVLPPTIFGPAGTPGFTPRWVNLATGASSSLTAAGISEELTVPVVYQWNLNSQYEFLPTWVLELGYVGAHGIHQEATGGNSGATAGAPAAIPFNIAPLVSASNPAITGVTTNTAQNATLRAPFLGISTQATQYQTISNYKYNSLQATVRKQFSHGLQLQAAYTWGRSFNSSPYGINTFPYLIQDYGPTVYVRPQRFVVNYVWNLPIRQREGIAGKLVNGWALSGVTVIQDGDPLTITDNRGGTIFGAANTLSTAQFCPGMGPANIATSGSLSDKVANGLAGGPGYLNGQSQGVFCKPPVLGTDGSTGFGNGGFGLLLGPGQDNWDISLSKATTVGGLSEAATLQFRAEFYNTFNHPQFSNPDVGANDGTFGQISTMSVNPRLIQLVLKYEF